jgi:flavin reductase (DIM6/NTAB) family NADH-FMN oxidoreductase RutF
VSKIAIPLTASIGRLVAPKPTVLVTCLDGRGKANIIAIAAVTIVSYEPPLYMIAVRDNRYSHDIISQTKEFVINVPSIDLVDEVHVCGSSSGSSVDKFKETGLTPAPAKKVNAPLIDECPINIECKVVTSIKPGTHTLFIGEVLATHIEQGLFDGEILDLEKFSVIIYNYGEYRTSGAIIKQI